MRDLSTREVAAVLSLFVRDYIVDVPAKHIDGDYLIPLGELEYALEYPDQNWLDALTLAVNNGE